MRGHNYTGETNIHGVKCLSQANGRMSCVCACGAQFDTTVGNFTITHGCKACRANAQRKRVQDERRRDRGEIANDSNSIGSGGKRGRPSNDMIQEELKYLDPRAMWKRICERHYRRESNITDIAERRRSE
ncbi:MAG: hypothetical protein J5622_05190 [Firmicutes bacterium]|nr:hypothetical protein [Bacillota bacterium]